MDKFGFVQAAFFIICNGIQVLKKFGLLNKLDVTLFWVLNYRLIYSISADWKRTEDE
jgi:hypothetical protein